MTPLNIWEAQTEIEVLEHPPVELSLDQCIKCNICVTVCPVSAVTDLFPGPKYEAPQAGRFRQPGQPAPDHSVDYCSGCRACNLACPTGVRIAEINARARAELVRQGRLSGRLRLRNNLLARPETLGRLGQPLAPVANLALRSRPGRWLADKMLGIAEEAPLPHFAGERFTRWLQSRSAGQPATRGKVVYFHGCSTEYYEPRVGKAAVQVLEANGFEVLVPPQNCCGLPLLSNGEFEAAREYHARNLARLVDYVRQGYVIVGTSTSCTLTLKEEAPELLDYFTPEAQLLARNTYDLSEFLVHLLEAGLLDTTDLRPVPLALAYHVPCQFKAHRIGRPSLALMAAIPGLTIHESSATCCGVAGTYGYKVDKHRIAMDVGRPLFDFVLDVGGPVAVCDSETCRWQITAGTGVPAVHPIELLAFAYGHEPEGALAEVLRGS